MGTSLLSAMRKERTTEADRVPTCMGLTPKYLIQRNSTTITNIRNITNISMLQRDRDEPFLYQCGALGNDGAYSLLEYFAKVQC